MSTTRSGRTYNIMSNETNTTTGTANVAQQPGNTSGGSREEAKPSDSMRAAFCSAIPVFTGLGGPEAVTLKDFCRSVDTSLEFSGLKGNEVLFWVVTKLDGPAKTWLQSNFVGENAVKKLKNWLELKAELQVKYAEPHAEVKAAMELAELMQGTRSVGEYTAEFNKKCEFFPDLNEKFLVGLYVSHLSHEVASFVKSHPANLLTLSKAQGAAILQNNEQKVGGTVQSVNFVTSHAGKSGGNRPRDQQNKQKKQKKVVNMADVECRRCRKKGHYARDCTTEVKDLPPVPASQPKSA